MSILSHFVISYYISLLVFGNWTFPFEVVLYAVVLGDLDRFRSLLQEQDFSFRKKLSAFLYGRMEYRTWWNELGGVGLVSILSGVLYFFVTDTIPLKVFVLSFFLRYILDFLTLKTRPLFPLAMNSVEMNILRKGRGRIYGDFFILAAATVLIFIRLA